MAAFIGYLRVSTKQQGDSGLGLEAQRSALEGYVRQAKGTLVTVDTEVQRGNRADRPELARAIAHSKRSKATLVVAKLDRLARNVEFLASVMNSGCEFAAADMPSANRFMLHIMAAVAEHEAKAISDRTKAALAASKARWGKLGAQLPQCRKLTREARLKGSQHAADARVKAANEAYTDLAPTMVKWRTEGLPLQRIAKRLNNEGHVTRRGKTWNPVQVSRVLERTQ